MIANNKSSGKGCRPNEPFWARMKELYEQKDYDQIFIEWKQKVLGGWGENMVESESWAKKDSGQIIANEE